MKHGNEPQLILPKESRAKNVRNHLFETIYEIFKCCFFVSFLVEIN